MAAPQGFEPRLTDPESAVLPLDEGAVLEASLLKFSIFLNNLPLQIRQPVVRIVQNVTIMVGFDSNICP